MSMTIEEFEGIKERVEKQKSLLEQRKGELKQLLKTLKEDFGCETLEEAHQMLSDMESKNKQLTDRLSSKTEELQKMWEEFENE